MQFSQLKEELAADSRRKGNNCIISIVGKHSKIPPLVQFNSAALLHKYQSFYWQMEDWIVPEDTIPTNVYTSSYLSHHTVEYRAQLIPAQLIPAQFIHGVSLMAEAQQDSYALITIITSRVAH